MQLMLNYHFLAALAATSAIAICLVWLFTAPRRSDHVALVRPLTIYLLLLLPGFIYQFALILFLIYLPSPSFSGTSSFLVWIEWCVDLVTLVAAPLFLVLFVWRLRRYLLEAQPSKSELN